MIDFHTHTFPDRIAGRALEKLRSASHTASFTDGTNEGLLWEMVESGVDLSVVLPVATSPRQVEHINEASAELNSRYAPADVRTLSENAAAGPYLLSLGAMHPDYGNWHEELLRVKKLGLRGIKIHPVYQGVDIDDLRFLRILDRCAELGLIVVMHAGEDIGFPGVIRCSPEMIKKAADEIRGIAEGFALILAHMGGWRNWEEARAILPGTEHLLIDTAFSTGAFKPLPDGYWKTEDTSMLDPEAFVRLVRAFGAEHVLFATDSPWASQRETIEFIRTSGLTEHELTLVFSQNAKKLLEGR